VVHEHDVVRATLLAAHNARVGSIYNLTDGRVHTVRDILRAIASAVDRPLLPGYLPATPVRFLAGVLEGALGLAGRKSPIVRATVDKLLEDVAVSGIGSSENWASYPYLIWPQAGGRQSVNLRPPKQIRADKG